MNTRRRDRVIRLMEHTAYRPTISATTHGPQYVQGLHTLPRTHVRHDNNHNRCDHLELAESPKTQPAWLSFYLITPPCRTCHTSAEFNAWLQKLRWFHQNCAPHSAFGPDRSSAPSKRSVGRPRSLSLAALERVLTLRRVGHGYRGAPPVS